MSIGQTLLVGGDDSHRQVQGEVAAAITAAMGLVGATAKGRKGNPDDDDAWFATDWMDSAKSQELLGFQHHTWPAILKETADRTGWKRPLFRVVAPLAHEYLKRQSPYYKQPGKYADPWGAVQRKWGRFEGGQGMSRPGGGHRRRRIGNRLGDARRSWPAEGCRVTIADRNTELAAQRAAELGEPHTWVAGGGDRRGDGGQLFRRRGGPRGRAARRW